jgi:hypothetical protein
VGFKWLPGLAFLTDVEPHEVNQALVHPHRWPRQMRAPDGGVFIAIWARTAAQRPIIVTVRPGAGFDSTIVAARPMTPSETARLELWEQNHE